MPEELEKDEEFEFDSEVVCPNCGQSSENETECPNCGAILDTEDEYKGFQGDEDF